MKHSTKTKNWTCPYFLILFFFSGLASLVYEVIWARKLGLVFGTTSYAISTVLAVFMAGLALGSFLFGRIVDRLKEPKNFLLLMGLLGVGEGTYAIFTPAIFGFVEKLQLILVQNLNLNPSPLNLNLLRFGLSFLALILPTTLCGGTLPVLSKFLIRLKEEVGEKFALIYSLNTFGGVVGVVLAGFFLIIPLGLGVNGTIQTAAIIDILAGFCFLGLALKHRETDAKQDAKPRQNIRVNQPTNPRPSASIILLIIFFFTGFLALALEVLWTRVLILTIGSSTYAFSLILAGFLTGIALGSILISKFVDKIKNLWFELALTISLIGIFVVVLTPLFDDLPFYFLKIFGTFGESFWQFEAAIFTIIFLILLLPTILMGITFPLGAKIYVRDLQKVGGRVGEIYSINTLGCIFGSFSAGFILLPAFGLQKSILLMAALYILIGSSIIFLSKELSGPKKGIIILFPIIALIIGGLLPNWNQLLLVSSPFLKQPGENVISQSQLKDRKILFYQEGREATVAVVKDRIGQLTLYINGKPDAGTGRDMETQVMLGALPVLLLPQAREALVIGLGSGVTLGSVLQSQNIQKVVAVEIEPAVVEAAKYFDEANYNTLNDPRVDIIIDDARAYILRNPNTYDIIVSEPSNPWIQGMGNLFTKEFLEMGNSRLKKEGIFVQWIHTYRLGPEDLKIILATFQSVFPNVLVFENFATTDLMLVGTKEEIKLSSPQITASLEEKSMGSNLLRAGVKDIADIASRLILDNEGIKNFTKGNPIHSDNYPVLDFSAPKTLYRYLKDEALLALREVGLVDPAQYFTGLSKEESQRVEELRLLREDILKARSLMFQDESRAVPLFEKAVNLVPYNPILKNDTADFLFFLGDAFFGRDREKAIEFYSKGIEYRKDSIALARLGASLIEKGDTEKGDAYLEEAIELDPSNPVVIATMGLWLAKQNKISEAINLIKEALEEEGESFELYNALGLIFLSQNNTREAKEMFLKSLNINKNQPLIRQRYESI